MVDIPAGSEIISTLAYSFLRAAEHLVSAIIYIRR